MGCDSGAEMAIARRADRRCSGASAFARAGVKQGQRRRVEPNWAELSIELKKPGVTLLILWEEYRSVHPDGYGYSRFCELFRNFEQRLSPTS